MAKFKHNSTPTEAGETDEPNLPARTLPGEPTDDRRRARGRRWGFRLAALVLVPVLFLAACELILFVAGTGYPTSFLLSSASDPAHLIDNYKFAWRFFPRALARSSQPLKIARQKPAGRKRIIVFGGSAAMGDPEPAFGLARVLEVLLESRFPQIDFEVINAAMTAINSHVVLPIARDCRRLDADAWVVYLGNNEVVGPFGAGTVFGRHGTPLWLIRSGLLLNRTRMGQFLAALQRDTGQSVPSSWGGMEMFLDHQVQRNDPHLQRVYQQFGRNLSDILAIAEADRIPVVVSTVVSNLRDCAPFASQPERSVSPDEHRQWKSLVEQGRAAQQNGQFAEAIVAYEAALEIDPEFAETAFRLAECLVQVGDSEEAKERFRQARDQDTLRFRSCTSINETIMSVAQRPNDPHVRLIDAIAEFDRQSPDEIVGNQLLCDHVHFTFAGNYLLAKLFADELVEVLELPDADAASAAWPSEQQCADRLGLTPYHRLLLVQELKARFRAPPFDTQPNHDVRDAWVDAEIQRLSRLLSPDMARVAVESYRQLLLQDPHDWVLREQFGTLLESTGDLEQAAEQWHAVAEQIPHHPEAFYKWGAILNQAKQYPAAEQALREALALRPNYARALNSLGISLSHQNRFTESYRQFAQATELQPDYAEAHLNWGLVLANQGDETAALPQFKAAVAADPDYLPAHVRLGQYYVRQQQFDAAEAHYQEVVRLKPKESIAYVNLGLLYLNTNQPDAAIRQLMTALELDPDNLVAQQAMQQARQMMIQLP